MELVRKGAPDLRVLPDEQELAIWGNESHRRRRIHPGHTDIGHAKPDIGMQVAHSDQCPSIHSTYYNYSGSTPLLRVYRECAKSRSQVNTDQVSIRGEG